MEKIKKELTEITEKWEKYVETNIEKTNNPDSYWKNMELLLLSRNSHHKEITNYNIEYMSDPDNKERQYIETIKRDCFIRFYDFSKAVRL